jgi:acyl transferase domain-containing protein
MFSTVTGAAVSGPELGASYWARGLREPVLFARAVASALASSDRTRARSPRRARASSMRAYSYSARATYGRIPHRAFVAIASS